MSIYGHAESFAGKPVVEWQPGIGITNPEAAYWVGLTYDEYAAVDKGLRWTDKFAEFLAEPNVDAVTALIVGPWDFAGDTIDAARVVEAIVSARDKLPRLTALFFGDIISEENEISWITQTDISSLFDAFPMLEHFRVRGGNNLSVGMIRHEHLQSLSAESGGLPANFVRSMLRAELPALEHLELWLGTENYGANTTIEDLNPLFAGRIFPNLRYLGLRDSDIANEIAAAVASSPLLERIRVLDLSLGILDDTGAEALLASPAITRLDKLDVHYHYCSDEMVTRLQALPIEVDASDQQAPDEYNGREYRYVSVGE